MAIIFAFFSEFLNYDLSYLGKYSFAFNEIWYTYRTYRQLEIRYYSNLKYLILLLFYIAAILYSSSQHSDLKRGTIKYKMAEYMGQQAFGGRYYCVIYLFKEVLRLFISLAQLSYHYCMYITNINDIIKSIYLTSFRACPTECCNLFIFLNFYSQI